VIIYTLMMGGRYGEDVRKGLLYYTRDASMSGIDASRDDVRNLVMARNKLAYYLSDDERLPEMYGKPVFNSNSHGSR
jgi:DNA replication ATP-dependent helicase Dna2